MGTLTNYSIVKEDKVNTNKLNNYSISDDYLIDYNKINLNVDDITTSLNKAKAIETTYPYQNEYDQDQGLFGIEAGKSARYGWYQGWAGAAYTVSGIPGWLDRGADAMVDFFGGEGAADKWTYDYLYGEDFTKQNNILSTEDYDKMDERIQFKRDLDKTTIKRAGYWALAHLDGAEEWLKKVSTGWRPEEQEWYRGFRPEGIVEKTISGFGGAAPIVGTLAAATALTRSPMAGFALVSFLDSYEQSIPRAIYNTSLGAIEGALFGAVASVNSWKLRVPGFAGIGMASAGIHGGSYDDVISSGIVMGSFAFGTPIGQKLGILKTDKQIKEERDTDFIKIEMESRDIIAEDIQRTNLHKDGVNKFVVDPKNSGVVIETTRIGEEKLRLETKVKLDKKKRKKSEKGESGNLETVILTAKGKKQWKKGEEFIEVKKLKEESKEENRQFDSTFLENKNNLPIKELKNSKEVLEMLEKRRLEEAERKLEYDIVNVRRDKIFNNGSALDIYIKLDGNGKVIGIADRASKETLDAEGFINLSQAVPKNFAFAERFGFKVGSDGSIVAKLSDLIKIKEEKGTRIESTKGWLTKAIKDATKIKAKVETDLLKRVTAYDKYLDTSVNTMNVLYNARFAAPNNIAGTPVETGSGRSLNEVAHIVLDAKGKIKVNGNRKESDIIENDLTGITKAFKESLAALEMYLITPKFIGGRDSSTVLKSIIYAYENAQATASARASEINYGLRIDSSGKYIKDPNYILEQSFKGIDWLAKTALSKPKSFRSRSSKLTEIEQLVSKGGQKGINTAIEIMKARIARDDIMYEEAVKNVEGKNRTAKKIEQEYFKRNKDGTYKYQMSYERMQKEFNLTDKQIEIIQFMDVGLRLDLAVYNDHVRKFPEQGNKFIEERPNYDVRTWAGNERAFIKTKVKVRTESGVTIPADKVIAVIPGHSPKELKKFLDSFKKDNPEYADASKYEITISPRGEASGKSGRDVIDAFESTHQFYNILNPEIVVAIKKAEKIYRTKKSYFSARSKREGARGFAGDLEANTNSLKYYLKGHRDYGTGAHKAATFMEFKSKWLDSLYSETGRQLREHFPKQLKVAEMYLDNAMGRNPSVLAKKADTVIDLTIGALDKIPGMRLVLGKDPIQRINTLTFYKTLLLWTFRFMKAQVIQPWQVVIPKLEALKMDYGIKGNTSEALLKGSWEVIMARDPQFIKALDIAAEQKVLDQLWMKEFRDIEGEVIKTKGEQLFSTTKDAASGYTIAGKLERFSRAQSFAFMYYFLKSANRDKQVGWEAMVKEAGELTNNLMVQYDYRNRAALYGNQGLGKAGPLVGLFKTFMHNYFGKTVEYARTWARGAAEEGGGIKALNKGYANPLIYHFVSQIMTAGLFGLMAADQIDWIIDSVNDIFVKNGKDPVLPTYSEMILQADLPMTAKFGLPSALVGGDLSSTLAAPGVGLQDIFSSPSLSFFFGLRENNHSGLIAEGIHLTTKKIAGTLNDGDIYKYLKIISPAIVQGEIDRRWGVTGTSKAGISYARIWGLEDPHKALIHDPLNAVYYEKVKDKYLLKDPYKGMIAKINRDAAGFRMKYLGGKSFEESLVLKTLWASTKLDNKTKTKVSVYVNSAAMELHNQRPETAMFYIEALMETGYTYDETMKKIFRRMDMMNNTALNRIKGFSKSGNQDRDNFLLEVIKNNKLDESYFPGSAYNN